MEKFERPVKSIEELSEGTEYSIKIMCSPYPEGIVLNGRPESTIKLEQISTENDSPIKYLPTSDELLYKEELYQSFKDTITIFFPAQFDNGDEESGFESDLFQEPIIKEIIREINDKYISMIKEEKYKVYEEFLESLFKDEGDINYLKKIIHTLDSLEIIE